MHCVGRQNPSIYRCFLNFNDDIILIGVSYWRQDGVDEAQADATAAQECLTEAQQRYKMHEGVINAANANLESAYDSQRSIEVRTRKEDVELKQADAAVKRAEAAVKQAEAVWKAEQAQAEAQMEALRRKAEMERNRCRITTP